MDKLKEYIVEKFFGKHDGSDGRIHYCPVCGRVIEKSDFRDRLSLEEFHISGMCQECQDTTFCPDTEEEDT